MPLTHTVWTYRDELRRGVDTVSDYVGYDVEAVDGHIGKVDKASEETGRQYLIVDTGFWIFGKKRMIPAGTVQRVDHDSRNVYVSMTKDQIKDAPDFDDAMTYAESDYDRFGSYYDRWGW